MVTSKRRKKKWAAYDVETEKLHYEVQGGWDNPAGFGFTVGSIVDNEGDEIIFSSHETPSAREDMVRELLKYERIVSFNGLRFDNMVLAAGDDIIQGQLDERSWDMKRLVELIIGTEDPRAPHLFGLNDIARATINATKSLADGRDAVRLWRKGDYEAVVHYNLNDTLLTAKIWEFGRRNGYVLFPPCRVPIVLHPKGCLRPEDEPESGLIVVKVRVEWN